MHALLLPFCFACLAVLILLDPRTMAITILLGLALMGGCAILGR